MSRFVDELKRRGVIRAALLYVGSAWIVLQVVDVVGDILNWPDSYGQFVLIVLVVGFPIAMVLSWFYQFTKRGIRQESDVTDLRSVSELSLIHI